MNSIRVFSSRWDVAPGATAVAPIVRAYMRRFPDASDRLRALRTGLAADERHDGGGLQTWLRWDEFTATDVPVLADPASARTEAKYPARRAAPQLA